MGNHDIDANSAFHAHTILPSLPNTIHRYMVEGDPVVMVPLKTMGFMHAGDGLELHASVDPECRHCQMDSVNVFTNPNVKRHGSHSYISEIKKYKQQCGQAGSVFSLPADPKE